MKTLQEVRSEFEEHAKFCMFDINRNKDGAYTDEGRSTYMLWAGYYTCAVDNGILVGDDADWIKSQFK